MQTKHPLFDDLTIGCMEKLLPWRPYLMEAIAAWKRDHPDDAGLPFSKLSQEATTWICQYAEVLRANTAVCAICDTSSPGTYYENIIEGALVCQRCKDIQDGAQ